MQKRHNSILTHWSYVSFALSHRILKCREQNFKAYMNMYSTSQELHWNTSVVRIICLVQLVTKLHLDDVNIYTPLLGYFVSIWSMSFWVNHITYTGTKHMPWWRHQMQTFSALLVLCAENSLVLGEFPAQRPVTRNFDVFFDLRPDKLLSKQWWGWWFETPSCPLWRHRNGICTLFLCLLWWHHQRLVDSHDIWRCSDMGTLALCEGIYRSQNASYVGFWASI